MPASLARRAARPEIEPAAPPSNSCGAEVEARLAQAAATEKLAAAGDKLASSIEGAVTVLKPLADGVHGLFEAQQKLCAFLVSHRLKLAASAPMVLIAIGAVSPNAADLLDRLLKAWGVL